MNGQRSVMVHQSALNPAPTTADVLLAPAMFAAAVAVGLGAFGAHALKARAEAIYAANA